jgi:Tfp pilus assembly protein PilF
MNERAREYFEAAFAAQRKGDYDRAAALYRLSIQAEPSAEAHTFLGWTYSFLKRLDDAIEECKRAIAVDPDFGNPYNDIGAYLIELGRDLEAIPWLQKAIVARRYDPRHYPHFNLARIYARRYEEAKALEHLEAAVALEPRYEIARRELAKLRARKN